MTKASKVLVVALLFFSVAFFAAAGVNAVIGTNWRREAESYNSKISEQQKQNTAYLARIEVVEPQIQVARDTITADLKAVETAIADLKAQLLEKQESLSKLSTQLVDLTRQTTDVRKVAALRREEVDQLISKLAELRTQKEQVQAEAKRLTDLLYQAQGTLERVLTRKQLLEADGAKLPSQPAAPPAKT